MKIAEIVVNPNMLMFREKNQNRLEQTRKLFPKGEGYFPIVLLRDPGEADEILDGHNRASIARERGDNLPAVTLSRQEYMQLRAEGFDDMEITYAALTLSGEYGAASAINQQFPGARIWERGEKAMSLLGELREGDLGVVHRDI